MLVTLIEKQGEIVTYDEISEILFKTEEEYSLYAISKTIQRLRDKLEKNGISGNLIQTLRKKGYLLKI